MATDFTQDSVLHFLQSRGGSAKNSDLLLHFRGFLRDHEDQVRNRDLFKRFVNSVATVRQEDGVSLVVLRKKFRGFVPGRGGAGAPGAGSGEKPRGERAAAPAGGALLPAAGIVQDGNKPAEPAAVRVGPGPSPGPSPRQAQKPQPVTPGVAEPPAREQRAVRAARQTVAFAPPPELRGAAPAQSLQPGPPDPRPGGRVPTDLRAGGGGPPDPRTPDPRPVGRVPNDLRPGGGGPPDPRPPDPRPGGGSPPDPRPVEGLPPADLQPQVRLVRHRKSYKSAVSYDDDEEEEEEEEEVQMVVGSTVGARPPSVPLGRSDGAAASPRPMDQPAPPPASSSSERKPPKIYIQDVEAEAPQPQPQPQPQPRAPGWPPEQGAGLSEHWVGRVPVEPMPERRSLPVQRCTPSPHRAEEEEEEAELHAYKQDRRCSQPAAVQPEPGKGWSQSERARLSSSHSSVFSPSSDAGFSSSEWPPSSSPRGSGWNSSYEDFQGGAADVGGAKVQEVLQRAQESVLHRGVVKTSAAWHRSAEQLHVDRELEARAQTLRRSTDCLHDNQLSAPKGLPWHLSTGDLCDDGESSDGSISSPPPTRRPSAARRVSSRLRSRMCRSLGANLDQLLQEEEAAAAGGGGGGGGAVGNEAARLNRLHMISSSLSLRYNLSSSSLSSCSTPPRCHSMADLTEDGDRKGRKRRSQPGSAPSASARQDASSSQVPLEPHEHAWLVKGAAGAWPDIYSLFREDPSLLNKRDFISGFTVLHWIAKHGDHRVLNTLWYGVEKAGLTLEVDARSACGHTPLHLAAMHNNKNMIRLLVSKFNADVKRRDTAGKRPWQYLSKAMPLDVFQMLGAPPRAALEGSVRRGGANTAEPGHEQKRHHQRHHRRRHHPSFASPGERPLTVAGKVKRSTSIAAFLKRKSLAQFQGLHSDSSV